MDSTFVAHPPIAPGSDMRCLSRPSLPTVTLRRSTSRAMRSSWAMRLIERLGDAPFRARPIRRQAHGEIAIAKRQHRRRAASESEPLNYSPPNAVPSCEACRSRTRRRRPTGAGRDMTSLIFHPWELADNRWAGANSTKRGGSRARLGPRAIEELLKSSNLLAPGCKRGRSRAVLLRPERASAASIEFLVRPGELIGERKSELQPMPDNAAASAPGLDRPSSIGRLAPPPSANLT